MELFTYCKIRHNFMDLKKFLQLFYILHLLYIIFIIIYVYLFLNLKNNVDDFMMQFLIVSHFSYSDTRFLFYFP